MLLGAHLCANNNKDGKGAGRVRGFGTYRLIFARQPPSPTVIVGSNQGNGSYVCNDGDGYDDKIMMIMGLGIRGWSEYWPTD